MSEAPSSRRLRADAERNRRQLLSAAAAMMIAEHGLDVPMERIARAAGVGAGTLYRRFADRKALLLELTITAIDDLLAEGTAAQDQESSAWLALDRALVQVSLSTEDTDLSLRDEPDVRRRRHRRPCRAEC